MRLRSFHLAAWCALLVAWLAFSPAQAEQGPHRAGLVVRFADGRVETRCVSFAEASITGTELLQRSGLTVTMDYNSGLGGAICSIADSGCVFPGQDCFCQCQGLSCEYWAYYHRTAGAWHYSLVGASSYQVTDGALEGWSWGAGNQSSGVEPPQISFDQVCMAATATPTATATAPSTPTPTATPPPTPTATNAVALPHVTFEAEPLAVTPGACAQLRWVVTGGEAVTLDGAAVAVQGQSDVCPVASQAYLLVAINAAGRTQRTLTVQVLAPTLTPRPTPPPPVVSWTPTAAAPLAVDLPAIATTQPNGEIFLSTPTVPALLHGPQPFAAVTPLPGSGERVIEVRFSPTPELAALGHASEPSGEGRPAPAAGPSPTPLLVAMAPTQAEAAQPPAAPLAGQPGPINAPAVDDLIPAYVAYLLTAGALATIGAWVSLRQR